MNKKDEKGITLITLVITIVLILIIAGMMGYYSSSAFNLQKINYMYSDIEQIQTGVDEYYIKNNSIPILKDVSVTFSKSSNPNDAENEYYVIDLSKVNDLRLNYGRDFEIIKDTTGQLNTSNNDVYIINSQSHTIYYLKGIEFEEKMYYTKPIEYNEII